MAQALNSLYTLHAVAKAFPLAALLVCGAATAQFKVIGPDGKVTYTDREPNAVEGKVVPIGSRGAPTAPAVELPFELRQIASRYPVTLYTVTGACEPCESGRSLLRQRGIPYSEKTITSTEDADAFERLSGGRDAPTLTIGSQTLRGLSPDVWASYLDAAGYPRESRLPANFQNRAPTPMVERREASVARPAQKGAADVAPTPVTPITAPPGASTIKF